MHQARRKFVQAGSWAPAIPSPAVPGHVPAGPAAVEEAEAAVEAADAKLAAAPLAMVPDADVEDDAVSDGDLTQFGVDEGGNVDPAKLLLAMPLKPAHVASR